MLTTGIPQIVAGIAVFLVCGVLLFLGKVRKRYWCLSCLVTALLVGSGIWCANDFFDLGMGTPKVFSPENWEKTKPEQRHCNAGGADLALKSCLRSPPSNLLLFGIQTVQATFDTLNGSGNT